MQYFASVSEQVCDRQLMRHAAGGMVIKRVDNINYIIKYIIFKYHMFLLCTLGSSVRFVRSTTGTGSDWVVSVCIYIYRKGRIRDPRKNSICFSLMKERTLQYIIQKNANPLAHIYIYIYICRSKEGRCGHEDQRLQSRVRRASPSPKKILEYWYIRHPNDPEHPLTLEQLNVVSVNHT